GGGVGHVAQDHHAVLGQGAVVVLVDRLQRAAAGGRVRRRVVLVFGGVVAAEHGVEGQAEAAAGPVLQRRGGAPLVLLVEVHAVADLVLEHDQVGLAGVGAVAHYHARVARQHLGGLGAARARGPKEARHGAEVDAGGGVGAVGAP